MCEYKKVIDDDDEKQEAQDKVYEKETRDKNFFDCREKSRAEGNEHKQDL